MAKGTNLITKIKLLGQVDPSLQKAFQQANKYADSSLNKLKQYGETVKKGMKIAGTAAVVGLGAAAKSAIEYESAFAGVKKTVEETKTTKYEDISNSIRNMAKTMPATTTEIAAVAEAAGQLGIKADDLSKFTEVMVNLGNTTNLSSEEAASSIAKMFNITGTSMKNVDRFGATIVALGNNAATTEADIVNMATRIASSGKQIGMNEQQILAMATSLSSVGLEAEAGGTAISTVMTNIDKEVALNGEKLATWAKVAGMSTGQFKKAWQTDAYGAMQKVIAGMGDTKANGGNLNTVLEELGVTGIRTSDTMKRLSSASGLMTNMTDLANKAWSENTALTAEAAQRYGTTESQLQIFKNRLNDVGITVGTALLPHLNKMLAKLGEVNFEAIANKIAGFIGKVANVFKWLSDHSTTVITILGMVGGAFAAVKIAGFISTVAGVVSWIIKLSKMFGFLKVAMVALGGPVTIAAAVIGALVAGFVVLWNKSEGFRNFWIGLWNTIKTAVQKAGAWLLNFFTVTVPNAWNTFVNYLSIGAGKVKTFFVNLGNGIANGFNSMIQWFASLPGKISTWFTNTIAKVNAWRLQMLAKAKEIGMNFVNGVVNFFSQLPYKIGYVIGFCIGKVIAFGQKLWNFATVTVPQFIVKVGQWFAKLPGRIWTWLTNTIAKINAWRLQMLAKAKEIGMKFITSVVNFFKQLPGKIWTWLVNVYTKAMTWGAKMVAKAREIGSRFINSVVTFFSQLPGRIWTWLSNIIQKVVTWGSNLVAKGKAAAIKLKDAIVNTVKEIPGKMLAIGKNIVTGLWNGIKNAKDWVMDKVKSFAKGILDGIADAVKLGSPSKITTEYGEFIGKGLGIGLEKTRAFVGKAVSKVGNVATAGFAKIAPVISPVIGKVAGKLPKHGDGGTFDRPHPAIIGDKPETIVPHGNTPHNRALLSQAAAGVGVSGGKGQTINITFAPVINGGNAEENRRMLLEEEEAFERKMDEYFERKWRLAF